MSTITLLEKLIGLLSANVFTTYQNDDLDSSGVLRVRKGGAIKGQFHRTVAAPNVHSDKSVQDFILSGFNKYRCIVL